MQEIIAMSPPALFVLIILVGIVCIAFRDAIIQLIKIALVIGAIYVILRAILYIIENSSINF